ncbi:unnamed protein product [Dicrocoelium dendriticum]|nr:unnamed protein product [Dicrocoelium dendriticum]
MMVRFSSHYVYVLHSHLSRSKRVYHLRIVTPAVDINVTTNYRIQLGPSITFTLVNQIDLNQSPYMQSSTEVFYEGETRKLQNSIEFGLVHTPVNFNLWFGAVAFTKAEMQAKVFLTHAYNWSHLVGGLEFDIPRLNITVFVTENIDMETEILFHEITNVKIQTPSGHEFSLFKVIRLENRTDSGGTIIKGQLISRSNFPWIEDLQLNYTHSSNGTWQDILVAGVLNDQYGLQVNKIKTQDTTAHHVQLQLQQDLAKARFVRRLQTETGLKDKTEIALDFPGGMYVLSAKCHIFTSEITYPGQSTSRNITAVLNLPKFGTIHLYHIFQHVNRKRFYIDQLIAVKQSDMFRLEAEYIKTKFAHMRLMLVPQTVLGTRIQNLTLLLQLVSPTKFDNIKQSSVHTVFQMEPWFPLTEGRFQVSTWEYSKGSMNGSDTVHIDEDNLQNGNFPIDNANVHVTRYQLRGMWNDSTQLFLLFKSSDNSFEITADLLSKHVQHPNVYVFLRHDGDVDGWTSSSKVDVDGINWWNSATELVHKSALHKVMFNISIGPLVEGLEQYRLFVHGKNESNSILLDVQQLGLSMINNRFFIHTNLPIAYQDLNVARQLYLTMKMLDAAFSIVVDVEKLVARVYFDALDGSHLDGRIGFETEKAELKCNWLKGYLDLNSTIPSVPSSKFSVYLRQTSPEKDHINIRFNVYLESHINKFLPKRSVNISIMSSNVNGETEQLLLESTGIGSLKVALKFRAYNGAYSYVHSIQHWLPGEIDTLSGWNTTMRCAVNDYQFTDCNLRVFSNSKQKSVALSATSYPKTFALQVAWDEQEHKLIGLTLAFKKGLTNIILKLPSRDLRLQLDMNPNDQSQGGNILLNISSFSTSEILEQIPKTVYAAARLHYHGNREVKSPWNWSLKGEVHSNLIVKERIVAVVNYSRYRQNMSLSMSSLLKDKVVNTFGLRLRKDSGNSLHSENILHWNKFTWNLTGLHKFQHSLLKSDSVLWLGDEKNFINITIDPWNKIQILVSTILFVCLKLQVFGEH